jgi:hypothetical protein
VSLEECVVSGQGNTAISANSGAIVSVTDACCATTGAAPKRGRAPSERFDLCNK